MNEVRTALEQLFVNGLLNPESVVEHAKDISSPLHSHFEWDDSEAASKYRLHQARALIRSVKIQVNKSVPVMVRAFVSLPSDQQSGGGYRRMEDVVNNDFMLRQLTQEISNKIEQWERKASEIGLVVDFGSVKESIKKAS